MKTSTEMRVLGIEYHLLETISRCDVINWLVEAMFECFWTLHFSTTAPFISRPWFLEQTMRCSNAARSLNRSMYHMTSITLHNSLTLDTWVHIRKHVWWQLQIVSGSRIIIENLPMCRYGKWWRARTRTLLWITEIWILKLILSQHNGKRQPSLGKIQLQTKHPADFWWRLSDSWLWRPYFILAVGTVWKV